MLGKDLQKASYTHYLADEVTLLAGDCSAGAELTRNVLESGKVNMLQGCKTS
jgi:hypothetical protein